MYMCEWKAIRLSEWRICTRSIIYNCVENAAQRPTTINHITKKFIFSVVNVVANVQCFYVCITHVSCARRLLA